MLQFYLLRRILRRHHARIMHQYCLLGHIIRMEVLYLKVVDCNRFFRYYPLGFLYCSSPGFRPDFVACSEILRCSKAFSLNIERMLVSGLYDLSVYRKPYDTVFFSDKYLVDFLQRLLVGLRILRPYIFSRFDGFYVLKAVLCVYLRSCGETCCRYSTRILLRCLIYLP